MAARSRAIQGSSDRLPSGMRPSTLPSFGGVEASLRGGRATAQHMHPRSENADDRVLLEHELVVEPVEPALDRLGPTARAHGQRKAGHKPRQAVEVVGGARMRDARLVGAVCLVPGRSPPVELGDELGLTPLQLGSQELSKLVVVPIPPAPPVEWHEEEVRPRDRLELARRTTGLEHGVAQRSAHPIENRCSRQEADVLRPQAGEVLEVEVVGHESVVTP